ncbi:hypothetical protein F443_03602 [Phytophthora nicotianae P1569]|uniref:Mitochondrial cardiolipin hydrolase n=1 Tax=Phytophthora nicotianae P1569 TaxID=1317065 RepID=V9FPP1_PHYNI|nr:hypothetical protein F443_03602 [Phytophthora nicotianae P1569]
MEPGQGVPMLGVGSDAVLAALATVVRKPKSKRQTATTRNSSVTAIPAPTTVAFPLETAAPLVQDIPTLEAAIPTVLLRTRENSAMVNDSTAASAEATRVESRSTDSHRVADSRVLGIANDAAIATMARKHKRKPAKTFVPTNANSPPKSSASLALPLFTCSVGSLVSNSLTPDIAGMTIRTTLDTVSSQSSDNSLLVSPCFAANSPITDTSLSAEDPSTFGIGSRDTLVKPKQPTPTISHHSHPTQASNFVDLTAIRRVNPNSADIVGIPTATFKQTTTVVDYWFSSDTRGENELVKYTKEATKTIKIGVDTLNHDEMIRELGAAVGRGVVAQLFIDFKACNGGLAWVKELLEAGVEMCHSTEKFEWKIALFDGQILVQGSQSWMKSDLQELNMDYTIVQTGSIVSAFECQFDKMWKAANKNVTKRARTFANTDQRDKTESSDSEGSSEMEPGKRRKLRKRTTFPTTLQFLEMMGL